MELTLFTFNAGKNNIVVIEPIVLRELKNIASKNIFWKLSALKKVFKSVDDLYSEYEGSTFNSSRKINIKDIIAKDK